MIVNLESQTKRSGLYFVYRGSVNLEKKGTYGLSHLGEHLFCKTYENLENGLQKHGIVANAYTSQNEIVFHFTGLEQHLNKFRDDLIDKFITGYDVTESDLENEKEIILEEYNDCFTDQTSIFFQNHMRKNHGTYLPIGLKEDIQNISYDDFIKFYKRQYNKPDMIINISEDYKLIRNDIVFENRKETIKTIWDSNPYAILEKSVDFDNNLCVLYEQEIDIKDYAYVKFIASMLSDGLNSPLYQEIREKRKLTYGISNTVNIIGNKAISIIFSNISPSKEDSLDEGISKVLISPNSMTEERFEIIKMSKMIKVESNEIDRYSNISDVIKPYIKEYMSLLPNLKYEDIMKYYNKYYNFGDFKKYTDK